MKKIIPIENIDQIKILSDARRLSILRHLMSKPATLSQLGRAMGEHPAWVRHHLKQLEQAGLVEISTVQVSGGFLEKYYQAKAQAFTIQKMILPEKKYSQSLSIVILASHDLALELLANQVNQKVKELELLVLAVGSLDGLLSLRQGISHLSGSHLLDPESGLYNQPYIKHFFPDRTVRLITLAHREQGLLIPLGNPHNIRQLEDIARVDLRFINRNKGSGTRIWLDFQIRKKGVPIGQINGYTQDVQTHTELAQRILNSHADIGLGLRAAAEMFHLDFIPLFKERYDLVVPQEQFEDSRLTPLFDYLYSKEFRYRVQKMAGYDTSHTGDEVYV